MPVVTELCKNAFARLVVVSLAAVIWFAGGCAVPGIPLAPSSPPAAHAPKPLPGEVAVMLPYDLRPSVEHAGSGPGLEYFIYLVFVVIDAERGSFVTSDVDFALPYPQKEGAARFGTNPVVAAAVGEDVFNAVAGAGIFERATRLLPPDGKGQWPLVDKPKSPTVQIFSGPPEVNSLCAAEGESIDLQDRALETPVPAFSSEWLLQTQIVHLYASEFSNTVHVIVASSNSSAESTQTLNYAPFANVVLKCKLYHRAAGGPALVWERSITGSEKSGPMAGNTYRTLVPLALANALQSMVANLASDTPGIVARIASSGPPVASADFMPPPHLGENHALQNH